MNVQLVQIRSRSLRLIAFCGHMVVVPSETLYLSVPQSLLWVACDQVDFTSSRFFLGWKLELAPTPKLGTMHCVSANFFCSCISNRIFSFFIVLSAVTSKCEKTRLEALAKGPLLGQFIPHCKEDGSFEPAQCWASTGYCWCVDENGEKRDGTTVRFEQPNCWKVRYKDIRSLVLTS